MRIENYKMLELNAGTEMHPPQAVPAKKRPRKLLVALSLLLFVLAVIIAKDSDFWFGSDDTADSDSASSSETVATTEDHAAPTKPALVEELQAPVAKTRHSAKTHAAPAIAQPSQEAVPSPETPMVATNRVVLPPLDVEVVAGDTHRTIHPGSNVTIAEIPGRSEHRSTVTASPATTPTNAAQTERVSAQQPSVDMSYPLLGKYSNVQGSVLLEAVVGADGAIENLRVLSGPAILSAAARQAVRQWRFKPYLQNGQAVETKARITVNFSIHVSDNPAKSS